MNKLFKNRGVVTKASCYTCGKNHSKIGKFVQENLDKLDDKTLIEMIENNVGKDLQWIRVNGAVCGFMIGLVLEGIKAII